MLCNYTVQYKWKKIKNKIKIEYDEILKIIIKKSLYYLFGLIVNFNNNDERERERVFWIVDIGFLIIKK